MRSVKHVLLGSAAGIFTVASAQAADLPVKAPAAAPVEYVRVCSLYGAGFWYIPGTDTCIKLGVFNKASYHYGATGAGSGFGYASNAQSADADGRFTRSDTQEMGMISQAKMSWDLRTQTEFGTLRQFTDVGVQVSGGGVAGNVGAAAAEVITDRAFIQFAGVTAGLMRSFYDIFFTGAYVVTGGHVSHDTAPNGTFGIAYSWSLGGGWSLSASLEDPGANTTGRGLSTVNLSSTSGNTAIGTSPAFGTGTMVTDVGGMQFMDPILNLRLDQEWGFAALSGAAHAVRGGYYTAAVPTGALVGQSGPCLPAFSASTNVNVGPATPVQGTTNNEACGHPSDAWGFAVNAGFTLINFLGMRGDNLGGQAVYSKGAAGYATAVGPNLFFKGSNTIAIGDLTDGVFTNGSNNISLTQVISYDVAYEHILNPNWRINLEGGEYFVDYGSGAKSLICPTPTSAPVGFIGQVSGFTNQAGSVYNCNPNYSYAQANFKVVWQPVPDINIEAGAGWNHFNSAFNGSTVTLPALGGRPSGLYTVGSSDQYIVGFQFQRFFLY
jgi:hypothetical protein